MIFGLSWAPVESKKEFKAFNEIHDRPQLLCCSPGKTAHLLPHSKEYLNSFIRVQERSQVTHWSSRKFSNLLMESIEYIKYFTGVQERSHYFNKVQRRPQIFH